ncbi:MAG TPA: pitrilysin family protein [Xanthomonadaceae bacterium]|nr:pitrilysin family protein [Xanthomonadaceae bacterium]
MTSHVRRLRSGLPAFSLSTTLAAILFAQPVLAATVDIPYSEFALPNGLRVIVHEDHKAPIVAVNLWYHVGSKDEKPGKTGFAHLYEHLMFEGSENHKGKYFDPFEKVGATDQNGTTNTDRTNFFENVPTTALDMALWMESDRMGHLLGGVDQATLDQQRGVVQNEKRGDENQPYGRVDDTMQAAMYPLAHPYHHTTLGSMADLGNASLDDVKTWFRTWYGPNNAVLVLAGDIDEATAKAKVARYFGDIPASPTNPMPKAWVAPRDKSTRGTMSDRVAQARIYREWNVPEFGNADLDRLQLFAQVLGGSRSSRLDTRLVHHDKLADHVSAYASSSELGSNFYITADVKQGVDPAKVEAIIDEELKRLLKDGPTAEETTRARTVFKAGFIRGIERIGGFGGKADTLAECTVFTGNPACFRDSLKILDTATPADLKAAGNRWLGKGDYTLVVSPGEIPPTVADASTANELYATKDRATPAIDPKFSVTKSDVDRSMGAPVVSSFPDLKFPALQRATLSNGMKIVLAERHEIPVVQMNMQFGGGYSADQGHKLGTASFTMGMLDEGAGKYDALAIGDREESLGASIGTGASLDGDSASLSALKDNLDDSLALYADVIRRPTFKPSEIERVRQAWLAGIKQEKTQPVGVALRLLPPLMYGAAHPYGIPFSGSGSEASIASLTRDDLVAFHQQWVRPDNATLIIVGDTTLKDITPLLEKHFGDWNAGTAPLPALTVPTVALPGKPRVVLVDQPGSNQANILVGQLVPSTMDPKAVDFDIANGVLGGEFSSRLNANLREDKHWAYGAYSFTPGAKGQRPWIAFAPVQIDKTTDSLKEMQRELEAYASGKAPATDAEIAKIKDTTVRSMPGAYETAGAVLGAIGGIVRYNRPDNYVQQHKQQVEAMSADAVHAATGDLKPTGMTWVVVGDLSKIEAPVRALNMGEIGIVDADGKPLAAGPVAQPARK